MELYVVHSPEHEGATGFMRPADASDVVEWLKQRGAAVKWFATVDTGPNLHTAVFPSKEEAEWYENNPETHLVYRIDA